MIGKVISYYRVTAKLGAGEMAHTARAIPARRAQRTNQPGESA